MNNLNNKPLIDILLNMKANKKGCHMHQLRLGGVNMVFSKGAISFVKSLTHPHQRNRFGLDAFLVLDLGFDIVDSVACLHTNTELLAALLANLQLEVPLLM